MANPTGLLACCEGGASKQQENDEIDQEGNSCPQCRTLEQGIRPQITLTGTRLAPCLSREGRLVA